MQKALLLLVVILFLAGCNNSSDQPAAPADTAAQQAADPAETDEVAAVDTMDVDPAETDDVDANEADPVDADPEATSEVDPAGDAADASDAVQITLASNDQMQFDMDEIRVKAGQTVTLTLTHTGSLDKTVMGHNFVLLTQGTDIATFGQQAMMAKDTEYIPEGESVIVHTALIGGGESDTITFEAPAAGTYDFICSFPGHYALMKGKFIVE